VKDVCDLIVRYDNVYADVSHHRVLTPKGRRSFVNGYRQMQKDYPTDIEKIKKRILCGSDWHVLRRMSGYRLPLDRGLVQPAQTSLRNRPDVTHQLRKEAPLQSDHRKR
jgi:hypothetical protein